MRDFAYGEMLIHLDRFAKILEYTINHNQKLTPEQNEKLNEKLHNINRIRP